MVVDGTVYVSDSGYEFAINATTGELRWSRTFEISNTYASPAVVDGVFYFVGWDGLLYALDTADGSTKWTSGVGFSSTNSPSVYDGKVIAPTSSKGVSAVNASNGVRLWNYAVSPGMGSCVAVAGGRVYVAGGDGNIVALDLNTGAKLWSYTLSNTGTSSSPAVANGILYIRGVDGVLYAFGKSDEASASVSPTVGLVGATQTLTVSGTGFTAGAILTATINGSAVTINKCRCRFSGALFRYHHLTLANPCWTTSYIPRRWTRTNRLNRLRGCADANLSLANVYAESPAHRHSRQR